MLSSWAILLLITSVLQGVVARTPGCGRSPPSSGTKSISGRQYILQVPANYNPEREYKLIFGFHWLGGNMNSVAPGFYGLRELAAESAIFVAPNGQNNGWYNNNGADVTFVDQILEQVQNELCVDETQRFSTGFSFGGAMSYALACARPNIFRAVSVIGAGNVSGCSGGTTPVAYLGIHGVVDSVLSVQQGRQLRDRFVGLNGCQARQAPEPPQGSSSNFIITEYRCRDGYPVWWIAHGGDHIPEARDSSGRNWMALETWDFWTNAVVGGGGGGPSPPTTTRTTTLPPPPTPTAVNCSARWGQCGGQGWNGPTCCQSGSTCQMQNQWYSQCL